MGSACSPLLCPCAREVVDSNNNLPGKLFPGELPLLCLLFPQLRVQSGWCQHTGQCSGSLQAALGLWGIWGPQTLGGICWSPQHRSLSMSDLPRDNPSLSLLSCTERSPRSSFRALWRSRGVSAWTSWSILVSEKASRALPPLHRGVSEGWKFAGKCVSPCWLLIQAHSIIQSMLGSS